MASAVLALATLYTVLSDPFKPGSFFPCPYIALTGHWCPGCGGLRAVHSLARGDIALALDMNPLVVLLIVPLGIAFIVSWFVVVARGGVAPRIPLSVGIALPVLLVVFGVLRNIPVLELLLAPG